MPPHNAFTRKFEGRVPVLLTGVQVCEALTPEEMKNRKVNLKNYTAIWDTGATNSAITKKVVDDLNLKPTGVVEVRHAKGKSLTNTYLANIALPNHVMIGQVRVSEADLISDDNVPEEHRPQVLIGMDIIASGDFAVTNGNGKTTLSFCIPPSRGIDFVPESDRKNLGGTRHERRERERQLRKQGLI